MRLAELRKSKKLSQKKLADMMGYSQNMISQWETGVRDPNTEALKKMAEIFGVSVDYILGNSSTMYPETLPKNYFAEKYFNEASISADVKNSILLLIQDAFDKAAAYKEHVEFGVPIKVESKQIPIAIGVRHTPERLGFEYTGQYVIGGDEYDVGEFVAFCCTGDNAKANDLEEGDIVIAQVQKDVESGDIALIAVNGSKLIVQRVTKFDSGIVLETAGENYSPLVITGDKLDAITIMGKVVEMRRKM